MVFRVENICVTESSARSKREKDAATNDNIILMDAEKHYQRSFFHSRMSVFNIVSETFSTFLRFVLEENVWESKKKRSGACAGFQ